MNPAPAASDASQALARLLGIRAGEGRRTLWAGLFHFGFVAAVVLVKSSSNALVVARYEAAALPVLYIASALATGLVAWLAAHLGRVDVVRLPRAGLLGAALVLGALAAAVRLDVPLAVTGLYLFGEVFATVTSIRYWSVASELFDPDQGKRLFGLLGGAGMAGAIVAGLAAQVLGETVGALGLLPIAVAAIVGTAAAGLAVGRTAAPRAVRREPDRREAWRYLASDSYPRALAALMLLLAALSALADYLFRVRAGETLSEDAMASLFGAFNLWLGVIAVLFQVGAAGRILRRWGIFRYLLLTPVGAAAAAFACLLSGGLWPAFALRLVEGTGSLAINPAAFQLLYGPLPDRVRASTRAAIDGLVKKAGFALGGALLLAFGAGGNAVVLAGLVLLVVGLYLLLLARAQRHYLRTLEERLETPVPRVPDLVSAEGRVVLERTLGDREPRRVLLALSLLDECTHFEPGAHLPKLLAHRDARVRAAAAALAGGRRIAQAAGHLERLAADEVPAVRDAAILALADAAPARAPELLGPRLAEPDPVAATALAALLRAGKGTGPAAALVEARLGVAAGGPPPLRRETARMLGLAGPSPFSGRLADFLHDPDPSVRRAAAEAAAEVREPSLGPSLACLLGELSTRPAARRALAALGDAVVPELARLLDDWDVALEIRLEIPRVLRDVGTAAAARALLFSRIQEDPYLRFRIARALSRIHEAHPEIRLDERRIGEAIVRRLDVYEKRLPVYRDLEAALPPGAILVRTLGDRLDQNLEIVFRLVGLRFSGRGVLAALRRFASGDARERAFAKEWLESLLAADEPLRDRILGLLERYHRLPEPWGGVPARPERARERIVELLVATDLVLRAAARHTARGLGLDVEGILGPDVPMEHFVSESVIEKVFFLEGVGIFADCDVDDLAALAAIARERGFGPAETVYREGDPGDTFYVITAGGVRFEKAGEEVVRLGVREAFGEVSLLDGAPRPVRAIAGDDGARVLSIERQEFLDLVTDRPKLLEGVFAAVARHLRLVLENRGPVRLATPSRAPAVGAPPPPSVRVAPEPG